MNFKILSENVKFIHFEGFEVSGVIICVMGFESGNLGSNLIVNERMSAHFDYILITTKDLLVSTAHVFLTHNFYYVLILAQGYNSNAC